jgi:hypothetical protein
MALVGDHDWCEAVMAMMSETCRNEIMSSRAVSIKVSQIIKWARGRGAVGYRGRYNALSSLILGLSWEIWNHYRLNAPAWPRKRNNSVCNQINGASMSTQPE